MSARDLVNAIIAGEAIEIENAFNSAMADKLSVGMDNMREHIASNMFNEEVEQLDELSKTTLASYIKKANSSTADNAWRAAGQSLGLTKDEREKHQQTAAKTTMKRMAGVSKATDKLAKEETELNLEDFSLEELQDFMMSEDFEQLDELSGDILRSYLRKTRETTGNNRAHAKNPEQDFLHSKYDVYTNKQAKGVARAQDRLHALKTGKAEHGPRDLAPKAYLEKGKKYAEKVSDLERKHDAVRRKQDAEREALAKKHKV